MPVFIIANSVQSLQACRASNHREVRNGAALVVRLGVEIVGCDEQDPGLLEVRGGYRRPVVGDLLELPIVIRYRLEIRGGSESTIAI